MLELREAEIAWLAQQQDAVDPGSADGSRPAKRQRRDLSTKAARGGEELLQRKFDDVVRMVVRGEVDAPRPETEAARRTLRNYMQACKRRVWVSGRAGFYDVHWQNLTQALPMSMPA